MSLVKDFKEFAIKGNVVDLAVGVIIGAAFGKIVSSFVADVIMPPCRLANSRIGRSLPSRAIEIFSLTPGCSATATCRASRAGPYTLSSMEHPTCRVGTARAVVIVTLSAEAGVKS